MANHRALQAVGLSLLSANLAACGAEAPDQPSGEPVAEASESVVNGTVLTSSQVQTLGLAAVYHFDPVNNRWFPRPCSGKIIRSVGGVSKVITARHCVTTTGAISGTVMTASNFRVAPATNPGLPNPNPPASAIVASGIAAAPVDSTIPDERRDQAVLTVNANWSAQAASKDALWVGDPSLLVGLRINSYGYGINVADWNCSLNISTVGAGVARGSASFNVLSSARSKAYGTYTFQNSNTSGQAVICGDSGGPDMLMLLGLSSYAGTHSTGGPSSATSVIPSFWLQQQVGGGYLSPYSTALNVGIDINEVVAAFPPGNANTIAFAYHLDLRQVRVMVSTARCLAFGVRSFDQTVGAITESCGTGGTNENWDLTQDQRLVSRAADGMCLTLASNNRLDLKPCLDARDGNVWKQRWLFHPQP